jgi:hypothetical protein
VRHWRILWAVVFLETPIFTKRVTARLTDEQYAALQAYLADHPNAGDVIRGSGGLRKIRWGAEGRGKRGGTRTIYFWARERDQILMLFLFAKNEQEDLAPEQLKVLRSAVEAEFDER